VAPRATSKLRSGASKTDTLLHTSVGRSGPIDESAVGPTEALFIFQCARAERV
jgi:hypothetical protein